MRLVEAQNRLPLSVARRLGGGFESVRETIIGCKLALQSSGPLGAILVAATGFAIPVQLDCEFSLYDLLCYMYEKNVLLGGAGNRKNRSLPVTSSSNGTHTRLKLCGNYAEKFRVLTLRYAQIFQERPRLGKVGLLKEASESKETYFRRISKGTWWSKYASDLEVFPPKRGEKTHKINLRFSEVWADVRSFFPEIAYIVAHDPLILRGLHNDQATAWLMWVVGACATMGPAALAVARVFGGEEAHLKEINTLVKALGGQSQDWGPVMCELLTLSGRGVNAGSAWDDIKTRVNERDFYEKKAAVCDMNRLEACIRRVVRSEMAETPRWLDRDDYWSRRWLYTRAGAHSRYGEKHWGIPRYNLPERPTRREFSEACDINLVGHGTPRVDAGYSEKDEHGKTRAIYGCDTRSYYTFDYLLRPIEGVWKNRRVLLDPGRSLQSMRYKELADRTGIRYMLDFDDFNSQHTLEAMKAVTRIACEGAPDDVLQWAIRSWDEQYVHWTNENMEMEERKIVGTLFSGHRATTFINTILNAAYCMYAAGEDWQYLDSYHCGDDVVTFGPEDAVSRYVLSITRSNFRINPAKQSVGYATGEFLRVAFNAHRAVGYGARVVSSMVSGNWVTDNRLDARSYIETLLRGAWTGAARFKCKHFGLVCRSSLLRMCPELGAHAVGLVTHRTSFNGSPVALQQKGTGVPVLRFEGGISTQKRSGMAYSGATNDFMSKHIDYTMLSATDYTPGDIKKIMLSASEKPRSRGPASAVSLFVEHSNRWYPSDLQRIAAIKSRDTKTRSEALNILQAMLTKVNWEKLVGVVRNVRSAGIALTGRSAWPVIAPYNVPYSDGMAVRDKITCTTALSALYPVMV